MTDLIPIPQPPTTPIFGNLKQMDGSAPTLSMIELAKEYGPLFKMCILGQEFFLASSHAVVNELCDTERFEKDVSGPLEAFREFAGDGLFTAYNHEPNWAKAHRILMPAFGPIGVRDMFDKMLDIASQMFVRWERFGPETPIDVAEDMTRLTLDTIALCGFGYRFNSFYQEDLHPFVDAMVSALVEGGARLRRPGFVNKLMRDTTHNYYNNIEIMRSTGQQLIDRRRADPPEDGFPDLLSRMLFAKDPETGEVLDDENIIYQMVTFLIAGHETTSSTLTFAVHFLLENPHILEKARTVVDEVLGTQTPRVEHLQHLRYIEQILMETLRHWPPAPAFSVRAKETTVVDGKYELTPEDSVVILIRSMHLDKNVWGADPERFDPDNFAPEQAKRRPANAWKPFGNGARACIGRPFAMQEAMLVLSMMLQRFDFDFDDPSYDLDVQDTSAMKPRNFKIRVTPRRSPEAYDTRGTPQSDAQTRTTNMTSSATEMPLAEDATPMTIAYGSNAGSSETLARRLQQQGRLHGFAPALVPMDALVDGLEDAELLAIVTASYEGEPPDNAKKFVPFLEGLPEQSLSHLSYSVFGCGNRQWARTFQAIPKRVDGAFSVAGANQIHDLGVGDSGGDFFEAFEDWSQGFWEGACEEYAKPKPNISNMRPVHLSFIPEDRAATLNLGGFKTGEVIESNGLVDMTFEGARAKHHIEIKLPAGVSYEAGDYLGVLGANPLSQTKRVLRHFGLLADSLIMLESGHEGLPLHRPVSCEDLITHYVELAEPATRSQVSFLAQSIKCPPEKKALETLASHEYEAKVSSLRVSVLDLLEKFPSCQISFGDFLGMLPLMQMRQYSISSTPLWNPDHVTLTIAVLDRPAFSGTGDYKGVASNFLASLNSGDRLSLKIISGSKHFRLPQDTSIPLIMACAGSGIAPFRGFIQERALQQQSGQDIAPILLFFGVDHPDCDLLYKDEFKQWQKDGVITPYFAFSEKPDGDIRFVQHRIWQERKSVMALMDKGAHFLTCGDGEHMEPAVRNTLLDIYVHKHRCTVQNGQEWLTSLENEHRYIADVFS